MVSLLHTSVTKYTLCVNACEHTYTFVCCTDCIRGAFLSLHKLGFWGEVLWLFFFVCFCRKKLSEQAVNVYLIKLQEDRQMLKSRLSDAQFVSLTTSCSSCIIETFNTASMQPMLIFCV